jgi:hypothetical protein
MASSIRRSDDLQRLKVRELVVQNTDGTSAPPNSILQMGGAQPGLLTLSSNIDVNTVNAGNVIISAGLTVTGGVPITGDVSITGALGVLGDATVAGDATVSGDVNISGDLDIGGRIGSASLEVDTLTTTTATVTESLTGSNVTLSGDGYKTGVLTVNGNAYINGDGNSTGSLTAQYITLPQLFSGTNNETYLWAEGEDLRWIGVNKPAEPISGWSGLLSPVGNIFQTILPSVAADVPSLVADFNTLALNYNRLLTLLSNRKILLSLETPATYPIIQFATDCNITFTTFPSNTPLDSRNITITLTPQGTAVDALVKQLNSQLTTSAVQLQLTYDFGTQLVTVTPTSGYRFEVSNSQSFGNGWRFLNHLGLGNDITLSNDLTTTYGAPITGSVAITNPFGSNIVPAPLGWAPFLVVASETPDGFTIQVNPSMVDLSIYTYAGIYLNGESWDIVNMTTAVDPLIPYVFENLSPNTTYSVTATLLTAFDESVQSPPLSVTTTAYPPTIRSYDVLNSIHMTLTPDTGPPVANKLHHVGKILPTLWGDPQMATLITVDQIVSVEIKYYAAVNVPSSQAIEAGFIVAIEYSAIFNAQANRISNPEAGDAYAVGSPMPPDAGPNLYPYGVQIISDQATLRKMFSAGEDNMISRSDFDIVCYWYTRGAQVLMNNAKIERFVINFNP